MTEHAAKDQELFHAYRSGAEGIGTFALRTDKRIHIDRHMRRGRCEQFLLLSVPAEPFLRGTKDDVFRAGRALSYLYAYLDSQGAPPAAAASLTKDIIRGVSSHQPPLVNAIFDAFRRWMRAHGLEEVRSNHVTFEEHYTVYANGGDDPGLDLTSPISRHPSHDFDKIDADVARLVELLDGADTIQLLWLTLYPVLIMPEGAQYELNLSAAYKTTEYLRALILQTNAGDRLLSVKEILELYTTLERMVSFYRDLPSWRTLDDPWVGLTVASAFLANSLSAPMVSVEQERQRTRELFSLYPDLISGEFGATAMDVDATCDALVSILSRRADKLQHRYRKTVSLVPTPSYWDRVTDFVRRLVRADAVPSHQDYWRLLEPFCFSAKELAMEHSANAEVVRRLSERRGNPLVYRYFSGDTRILNPAEERPIVRVSDELYFLPMANPLYHAVHMRGLRAVTVDNSKTRQRDRYLENKVATLFARLFPDAQLYRSYERDGGESDLCVVMGRTLMIIESKAGAPPAALRDPDRAYERLRQTSKESNNKSPFHGIRQGQRLIRALMTAGSIDLVSDGCATKLNAANFDEYFVVCVTLFDWAPLVINWDLLRQVDRTLGYPFAIDYDRLEAFAQALLLRKWDGADFLQYLRERHEVHGKIFTFDELDYAANFILDGDLQSLTCTSNIYSFRGRGPSSVFDDIETAFRTGSGLRLPQCNRPSLR